MNLYWTFRNTAVFIVSKVIKAFCVKASELKHFDSSCSKHPQGGGCSLPAESPRYPVKN